MFPRTLLILITSQFSFPAFRGKNDMLCKTWILFMIYCKRFWRDTWWGLKRKQKRFQFCVQSSDLQILILIPLVYNWTKSIWQKIWKIFVTRCDFLGWKPSHWKHPTSRKQSMLCTEYTMLYTGYMLHKYRAMIVNHCQWNNALHNVHIERERSLVLISKI